MERPLCSFLRFSLDGRQTSSAASELLDRRSLSIVGDSPSALSALSFSYFPLFHFFSLFSPCPRGFPFLLLSSLLSSLLSFPIFSLKFPFTPYLSFSVLFFAFLHFSPFFSTFADIIHFFHLTLPQNNWTDLANSSCYTRLVWKQASVREKEREIETHLYTHQGTHLVLDKGRPATLFEGQIVQGRSSFQRSGSVEFSLLPSLTLSSFSLLPRDRTVDLLARSGRQSGKRKE